MMASKWWWRAGMTTGISIFSLALAIAATARAAGPASQPATAATNPTTNPAGDGKTTAVKRGDINVCQDVDGVFAPVDPFEVRLKLKKFASPLIIVQTIASNSAVHQGDVLITLETRDIDIQIAAAENELKNAHANLVKLKADGQIADKSETLAQDNATMEIETAKKTLRRWDEKDSAMANLEVSMMTRIGDFYVENATDELDQLKKMYKSEDLTNQTADIVLKRAVHMLDLEKLMAQISHNQTDHTTELVLPTERQQLITTAEESQLSLASLQTAQAQQKVVRETGLAAAQAAVDAAQRTLDELHADREKLTVKSTIDGIVIYGAFANKAWAPVDPEHYAAGEKVQAEQTLLTVFTPGKLRLLVDWPEAHASLLGKGTKVKVQPAARPDISYDGTVASIPVIGQAHALEAKIDLPPVDEHLAPGYAATVLFDGGMLHNVLLAPATAVWHNKVWIVHNGDVDHSEPRIVSVGYSDGTQTDILSGVHEGDTLLTQAKHPGGGQ